MSNLKCWDATWCDLWALSYAKLGRSSLPSGHLLTAATHSSVSHQVSWRDKLLHCFLPTLYYLKLHDLFQRLQKLQWQKGICHTSVGALSKMYGFGIANIMCNKLIPFDLFSHFTLKCYFLLCLLIFYKRLLQLWDNWWQGSNRSAALLMTTSIPTIESYSHEVYTLTMIHDKHSHTHTHTHTISCWV